MCAIPTFSPLWSAGKADAAQATLQQQRAAQFDRQIEKGPELTIGVFDCISASVPEPRWPPRASVPSPAGFLTGFSEPLEKKHPVLITQEDRLASIPAIHEVIDRPSHSTGGLHGTAANAAIPPWIRQ